MAESIKSAKMERQGGPRLRGPRGQDLQACLACSGDVRLKEHPRTMMSSTYLIFIPGESF